MSDRYRPRSPPVRRGSGRDDRSRANDQDSSRRRGQPVYRDDRPARPWRNDRDRRDDEQFREQSIHEDRPGSSPNARRPNFEFDDTRHDDQDYDRRNRRRAADQEPARRANDRNGRYDRNSTRMDDAGQTHSFGDNRKDLQPNGKQNYERKNENRRNTERATIRRQQSPTDFRRPSDRSAREYSSDEDERAARRRSSDRRAGIPVDRSLQRNESLDRNPRDDFRANGNMPIKESAAGMTRSRDQTRRSRSPRRQFDSEDRARQRSMSAHSVEAPLRRSTPVRGQRNARFRSPSPGSASPEHWQDSRSQRNSQRNRQVSIASNASDRSSYRTHPAEDRPQDSRTHKTFRRRSPSPLPAYLRNPVSRSSPPRHTPQEKHLNRSRRSSESLERAQNLSRETYERRGDAQINGTKRRIRSRTPPEVRDRLDRGHLPPQSELVPNRFRSRERGADRSNANQSNRQPRYGNNRSDDNVHPQRHFRDRSRPSIDAAQAQRRDVEELPRPLATSGEDNYAIDTFASQANPADTQGPLPIETAKDRPSMSPELADLLQSPEMETISATALQHANGGSGDLRVKRNQQTELETTSPAKRSKLDHGQQQFCTPESIKTPHAAKVKQLSNGKRKVERIRVNQADEAPQRSVKSVEDVSIYERIGQVGEGTYGKVYKARHRKTDEFVALKRIRLESERDGFPITSMREIKLLQRLRHPGIVKLLEMMIERSAVYMVFEYMDHDLTGILSNTNITFEPPHIKDLAYQLFDGLAYLHHRGVLHRDIKGSNILLNNAGQLKLADFGLARFYRKTQMHADYTNRVITLWFRPPELLLGATAYDAGVDVWSAGCIFVELFTKSTIFPGRDEIHQIETIYQLLGSPTPENWPDVSRLPWYELIKFKPFPPRFEETFKTVLSPAAMELSLSILQLDPARRPLAADVLEHPYFTTEAPKAERRTLMDIVESHEWDSKQRRRDERAKKVKDEKGIAVASSSGSADK